ncbi:MAG: hypothetical protein WDN49_03780 [Acetobacteraceae bacterium]
MPDMGDLLGQAQPFVGVRRRRLLLVQPGVGVPQCGFRQFALADLLQQVAVRVLRPVALGAHLADEGDHLPRPAAGAAAATRR